MNKFKILAIVFLTATTLSTRGIAQDANVSVVSNDLAKIIYDAGRTLAKQQGRLEFAHESLLEALEKYKLSDAATDKDVLLKAAAKDAQEAQAYAEIVGSVNSSIAQASSKYYEETPATKTEIEEGPKGKGVPSGGESVAQEVPEAPPVILSTLNKEIKANGGLHGNFADQLRKQKEQLKNTQAQIGTELNSPAVQSNPKAKSQDEDLRSVLERAINARRKALQEN